MKAFPLVLVAACAALTACGGLEVQPPEYFPNYVADGGTLPDAGNRPDAGNTTRPDAGGTFTCSASTCAGGCCSGNQCLAGTIAAACGTAGEACTSCEALQTCNSEHVCVFDVERKWKLALTGMTIAAKKPDDKTWDVRNVLHPSTELPDVYVTITWTGGGSLKSDYNPNEDTLSPSWSPPIGPVLSAGVLMSEGITIQVDDRDVGGLGDDPVAAPKVFKLTEADFSESTFVAAWDSVTQANFVLQAQ